MMISPNFYPRSPCGERRPATQAASTRTGFLSTLSLRRATTEIPVGWWKMQFLSTLSLRRATLKNAITAAPQQDFYPRSPCGERRIYANTWTLAKAISIHALLAESDRAEMQPLAPRSRFLSTLSLRRATDDLKVPASVSKISIHALLAESDPW